MNPTYNSTQPPYTDYLVLVEEDFAPSEGMKYPWIETTLSWPTIENLQLGIKQAESKVDLLQENQRLEEKQREREESSQWFCNVCTFANAASAGYCSMCSTSRQKELPAADHPGSVPPSTQSPSLSSTPTPSLSSSSGPWECPTCTYSNRSVLSTCSMCDTPKPASLRTSTPAVTTTPTATTPTTTTTPTSTISPQTSPLLSSSSSSISKKNSKETAKEEQEPAVQTDLIFTQLRSRCLKAFTALLQHKDNATNLFKEGGLSSLLSMAVRPSKLDEFKAVEQLEMQEERIWELLYQFKHNIVEDSMTQRQSLSQAELLKHSPLAKLPLILPSQLDRGSAKRVAFPQGDLRTVVRSMREFDFGIGLVRSNSVIPNSLPAYYFEIRLHPLEGFSPMEVEGGYVLLLLT